VGCLAEQTRILLLHHASGETNRSVHVFATLILSGLTIGFDTSPILRHGLLIDIIAGVR